MTFLIKKESKKKKIVSKRDFYINIMVWSSSENEREKEMIWFVKQFIEIIRRYLLNGYN